MNNEAVSAAESVPDQVGDVLRAKHAGSRVVLPTGSTALCHLPSWLVCALWRVWAVGGSRGSRNPSWCQINTGTEVACPATKQIGKRWEALRRERGEKQPGVRVSGPWTLLQLFFSLSFTLLPLLEATSLENPSLSTTDPLDSEVLKWREAVRACSLFCLYCQRGQRCPFKRVHHFPDKITYKVTTTVQTPRRPLMDKATG